MTDALLRVTGLNKHFGGVIASDKGTAGWHCGR